MMEMKKMQFVIARTFCVLLLGLFIVSACNREEENVLPPRGGKKAPETVMMPKASGGLGYIDQTGALRPIPEAHLKLFYRQILGLEDNVVLEDHTIQELQNPETGQSEFVLRVLSADHSMRISTEVNESGGFYLLNQSNTTSTCVCKTVSCSSDWGCDSEVIGGKCKCSPCTGDCSKKETTTQSAMIIQIFNYLAIASL